MVEIDENRNIHKQRCGEQLLDYEKKRYKRKGYGFFVACISNILFFGLFPQILMYFWPSKIENVGLFYALSAFITHETVFILTNLYFLIIHKLELPFFERYKTSPNPWPWQKDKENWKTLLKNTFKTIFINHLLIQPMLLLPNIILNDCPYRTDIDSFPSIVELLAQVTFCMLMEDFSFYWSHRTLHHPKIYPKIHKTHHEYIEAVCISSEYAHPLEYIFGNVLTTNIGGLILGKRMHLITYITWLSIIIHESIDGHCGYDFSWSPHRLIPLNTGAEFHIFHHLKYKGNYASTFTIWDRLGNTVNKHYLKYFENKDKINKID